MGWFRPVHRKSPDAQEVRALLVGRKPLQAKLRDVEQSIRGILRGFGPPCVREVVRRLDMISRFQMGGTEG